MSLKLYKYANLINKNTPYAKKMRVLSNQIFGEVVRETNSKSMKVVKLYSENPAYRMEEVIKYYPRHPELGALMKLLREYGLYRDEHEDFKEEMVRLRALRGKTPWVLRRGTKKETTLLDTKK